MNVNELADGRKNVNVEGRQCRDSKDGDTCGYCGWNHDHLPQPFKELLTDSRPMPHSSLANHRTPQLRLPVRLFAMLPSQDHLGTIDRVLVENVSHAVAKLLWREATPAIGAVVLETFESWPVEVARQKALNAPG